MPCHRQLTLFDEPEDEQDPEASSTGTESTEPSLGEVKDGLDELFALAGRYRDGKEYMKLLGFVRGFRFYSRFNAMLIYTQRPGATYVATPKRWLERYGYHIKTSATPITILRPMGPVMFVFDISDIEPGPFARQLPAQISDPFAIQHGKVGQQLDLTIENALRDGVDISDHLAGSQLAGSIRQSGTAQTLKAVRSRKPEITYETVPRRYEMLLSTHLSKEARYATLVHELGHLYCGHIGSPNAKWWPDRRGLSRVVEGLKLSPSATWFVDGLGSRLRQTNIFPDTCSRQTASSLR